MTGEESEQRHIARFRELGPVGDSTVPARIDGPELDDSVGSGLDRGMCSQTDRGIQRQCAFVEQIERPDVDGAAGEVDSGRS